jgi:hypothetical protein
LDEDFLLFEFELVVVLLLFFFVVVFLDVSELESPVVLSDPLPLFPPSETVSSFLDLLPDPLLFPFEESEESDELFNDSSDELLFDDPESLLFRDSSDDSFVWISPEIS